MAKFTKRRHSCLGFVQANHRINGLQNESFVRDFHRLVDVGWKHHHLPRNRYGLAFCFGHGVVLRTEAWKQVGGFPLMVSEDIALTLSMRRQGYFGRHVPEVICGEGIPLTLGTWRKRHFRMVTADLECFFRAVVPFIWSKEVTLVEKVDATVCTLRITLSALFLPFLLASSFLLLALEESSEPASVLTSWDFLMVNLLVASGGYVRFVSDLFPQVGNAARLISQITALQLSLFLTSILGVFTYGVTRRAHFFVTAAPAGSDGPVKGTSFLGCLAALNPNHTMVLAAEAILSLLLAYFALTTLNWVMLAVSLSVFVMLLRHRLGWDWLPGRVLVHAPTLLLLLAVFSGLPGVPGLPGQVLILASLSVLVYS
ncbi:MAG: glycosyltransferase family 2 protein [Dehalococcoidia bacterium]